MSDFHARRDIFCAAMERHGMDRDGANYCISVGARLRRIYAQSAQVEALEAETVTALQNFLGRLRSAYRVQTDETVSWECVLGGLEAGDDTVLYIVPPLTFPVAVPLPSVDVATQVEQAGQEARTQTEVQAILDAWNKERPNDEMMSREDINRMMKQALEWWQGGFDKIDWRHGNELQQKAKADGRGERGPPRIEYNKEFIPELFSDEAYHVKSIDHLREKEAKQKRSSRYRK